MSKIMSRHRRPHSSGKPQALQQVQPFQEGGQSPALASYHRRCRRHIACQRLFISTDDGRLVFGRGAAVRSGACCLAMCGNPRMRFFCGVDICTAVNVGVSDGVVSLLVTRVVGSSPSWCAYAHRFVVESVDTYPAWLPPPLRRWKKFTSNQ